MPNIAEPHEFIRNPSDCIRRNRETDPVIAGVIGRKDCCIDPDDLTLVVQKRAAGVPMIDRSVGLDDVIDDSTIGRLNRTAKRTDDAGCHCAIQTKRVADSEDLLSDLKSLRRAQRNRRQARACIDLNDGQVIVGIRSDNPGLMLCLVGQRDFQQFGVLYDVEVGDDVTLGIDDGARTHAGLWNGPQKEIAAGHTGRCDIHHSLAVLLIDLNVVSFIIGQWSGRGTSRTGGARRR